MEDHFPFMSLPPEIRIMIYEKFMPRKVKPAALGDPHANWANKWITTSSPRTNEKMLKLLLLNREIHDDASHCFYSTTELSVIIDAHNSYNLAIRPKYPKNSMEKRLTAFLSVLARFHRVKLYFCFDHHMKPGYQYHLSAMQQVCEALLPVVAAAATAAQGYGNKTVRQKKRIELQLCVHTLDGICTLSGENRDRQSDLLDTQDKIVSLMAPLRSIAVVTCIVPNVTWWKRHLLPEFYQNLNTFQANCESAGLDVVRNSNNYLHTRLTCPPGCMDA